jgi:hypothetical protein
MWYLGHRHPMLQVSALTPTCLLLSPTLKWCGGWQLAKAENTEEIGEGVGHSGC